MNTRFLVPAALLTLQLAAHADSLAAKFDFEATDSLANWHQDLPKGETLNTVALDSDAAHSGTTGLKFTIVNPSETSRTLYTGITLPGEAAKGRRLRLTFYSKSANLTGGQGRVSILERSKTSVIGWAGNKAVYEAKSTPDWQENVIEVPLKEDTRVLTLFFGITKPTLGQTLSLDDVSAEVLEPTP